MHRVHRRTVRAALADAVPPERKVPVRMRPVAGPWVDTIRGWLEADLSEPRKQRHTARRVWQRLLDEKAARVSESTIRALVHDLRIEIGADRQLVAVPQTHLPGAEAEVDFGDFMAVIGGERLQLHMFVMRLSHSGRAVHVAFGNVGTEAFLDGHVQAFEHFGGVPTGKIRYDNLKPAVLQVLLGRERLENPQFIALRSHYGFDSFFCQPGIEGAHEKGGVEGEIGRFRRRHLTPVPTAASLGSVEPDDRRGRRPGRSSADRGPSRDRRAGRRPRSAVAEPVTGQCFPRGGGVVVPGRRQGQDLCAAVLLLGPGAVRRPPGRRLAGRRTGSMSATTGRSIARHTRSLHKGSEDLVLDHYLDVLAHRPGAFAGATALVAARAAGTFTDGHQRFWDAARRQAGDRDGTKALIGVLAAAPHPAHRSGPGRDRQPPWPAAGASLIWSRWRPAGYLDNGRGPPPVPAARQGFPRMSGRCRPCNGYDELLEGA